MGDGLQKAFNSMKIKGISYAWILILLAIIACDSETKKVDPEALGYHYYPVQVGDYRIYDIQDITFTLLEGADTNNYQLKEVVHDYYQQNQDDTTYYLYRYSRNPQTEEEWNLDSVWTVRKDARRVIVMENNIPYIKLVFPFQTGQSWDANGMNAEEPSFYTISKTGENFHNGDQSYESTVTVVEKNNMDTVIQERYSEAVYAAEVGLVYRELRYIDYCATTVECLGLGIIEGGRKYVQQLTEYGKE